MFSSIVLVENEPARYFFRPDAAVNICFYDDYRDDSKLVRQTSNLTTYET